MQPHLSSLRPAPLLRIAGLPPACALTWTSRIGRDAGVVERFERWRTFDA